MTNIKPSQILFVLLFVFFHLFSFSQQNRIDSLQKIVQNGIDDTNKVNAFNELCKIVGWQVGDYDTAKYYANSAQILAKKLLFEKGIATSYSNIGVINTGLGNYSEALKNHLIALEMRKHIRNKKGIATSYNNIGIVFHNMGNYTEALKNYFNALIIRKEIGEKIDIAISHNNIGSIYMEQGNYKEALKNNFEALEIRKKIADSYGIADSYNNIGVVYLRQAFYLGEGNFSEALKYFQVALKLREEIGDNQGINISLTNIGGIYSLQRDYNAALKNYLIALKSMSEIGDKRGVAKTNMDIGNIYFITGKVKEGKEWQQKALSQASEIGAKEIIKDCYISLAQADSTLGNYKDAYNNYKMYITYRDSLFNEENVKKTVELQMQSDFDIKAAQSKAEQDKKDVIANEEKRRQQLFLLFVGAVAIAVIIIAVIIFRSLSITRRQKKIIETQKNEAEQQKHIIEKKNRSITDSIDYAHLIQRAMLPHRRDIWAAFTNSFVLYKPKDIVSGDFYFFTSINNFNHIIAAADCTGHGVPGGFMTMLGAERLAEAVKQTQNPAEILALLNKWIKRSLKQSNSRASSRDGMDIAVCNVDTLSRTVQYSSANRPLWIVRKGASEIEEIKPTKRGIGGFTTDEQQFEQHTILFQEGDTFYIFSDGYGDLFSGDGKKLTTKRFKQLLLEIQDKPMKEQGRYLDEFAENWKGRKEQIDDILVIGIRL